MMVCSLYPKRAISAVPGYENSHTGRVQYLLGNGGEIQLPQNAKNITIKGMEVLPADGKEIGKIRIVKVSDLSTLESVGVVLQGIG